MTVFSLSINVFSEVLSRAQISEWTGVEPVARGFNVGDLIDSLDPEGPRRGLTTWSFEPDGVRESADIEPWMTQLRPVLERMQDDPPGPTTQRVFIGHRGADGGGRIIVTGSDLELIARARCVLDIDAYDSVEPTSVLVSLFRRARRSLLTWAGVYRRRDSRRERARAAARDARIAARNSHGSEHS